MEMNSKGEIRGSIKHHMKFNGKPIVLEFSLGWQIDKVVSDELPCYTDIDALVADGYVPIEDCVKGYSEYMKLKKVHCGLDLRDIDKRDIERLQVKLISHLVNANISPAYVYSSGCYYIVFMCKPENTEPVKQTLIPDSPRQDIPKVKVYEVHKQETYENCGLVAGDVYATVNSVDVKIESVETIFMNGLVVDVYTIELGELSQLDLMSFMSDDFFHAYIILTPYNDIIADFTLDVKMYSDLETEVHSKGTPVN